MKRSLQFMLVWFMAFALPAQGMAATVMAACGPHHARALQTVAEPAQHEAQATHAGHAATYAAGAALDVADDATGAIAFTCEACASCCSAVPIVDATPAVHIDAVGSIAVPWTSTRLRSVIVAFPERPPRNPLA